MIQARDKNTPHHTARVFHLDSPPQTRVLPGFATAGLRFDGAITPVNGFGRGCRSAGSPSHPFDLLSDVPSGAMRVRVAGDVLGVPAPSALQIPGGLHCDERVLNVDIFMPLEANYLPLCEQ